MPGVRPATPQSKADPTASFAKRSWLLFIAVLEAVIASLRLLFPARADGWTKRWDELATRLQTIIDDPTPAFDKARETLACSSRPRERRLIDTSPRPLDTGNVLERNEGDPGLAMSSARASGNRAAASPSRLARSASLPALARASVWARSRAASSR